MPNAHDKHLLRIDQLIHKTLEDMKSFSSPCVQRERLEQNLEVLEDAKKRFGGKEKEKVVEKEKIVEKPVKEEKAEKPKKVEKPKLAPIIVKTKRSPMKTVILSQESSVAQPTIRLIGLIITGIITAGSPYLTFSRLK